MLFVQPLSLLDGVLFISALSLTIVFLRHVHASRILASLSTTPSVFITGSNHVHSRSVLKHMSSRVQRHPHASIEIGHSMHGNKKIHIVSAPVFKHGTLNLGLLDELERMRCRSAAYIFDGSGSTPLHHELTAFETTRKKFGKNILPAVHVQTRNSTHVAKLKSHFRNLHEISENDGSIEKFRELLFSL